MAQHLARFLQRAALCPGCLMEELQQLLGAEIFLFREGNDGLERRGHLVLEYFLVSYKK